MLSWSVTLLFLVLLLNDACLRAAPFFILSSDCVTPMCLSVSRKVCELVCDLAKQHGKTIICTIHQPTFATLLCFSKLLVLAKGRVVYDGQPDGIIDYMALHKHPAPVQFIS